MPGLPNWKKAKTWIRLNATPNRVATRGARRAIYHFLAKSNLDAAKRAVNAIRESGQIIARQPEIGRPVEEMQPEFREWMIGFGDSG